jgi:hypothetical protein
MSINMVEALREIEYAGRLRDNVKNPPQGPLVMCDLQWVRVTCGGRLYQKNKMATIARYKLIDKSSNEKNCFLLTSILKRHLEESCPIHYNIHANNVLCASDWRDSVCHLQKWTLR